MRWLVLLVGTVAATVVFVSAPVAAPPSETRYVAQLRAAAAQVDASYNELRALKADDPALVAAGARLGNAAGAACRTLRVYERATFRFGTDEEYRLVRALEQQLQSARARYGSLTGVSLAGPTKTQLSTARQLFLAEVQAIAAAKVGRWVKDERLGEILTVGDVKQVRAELAKELTRRIDAAARGFSQRAIGLSLSLGSPLKTQLRLQAEQAVLNWLSRVAFHWDPTGVAIRIVGTPIVRFLRTELKELFRDHTHVVARTDRTVNGFQSRVAELQKLLATADGSRLATVESSLARAQHAIDATVYLKSDLGKQGRTELIARLTRAEDALLATMRQVREDFLLDSSLARADLRQLADNACKVQGEVAKIAKQAKAKPGTFAITRVRVTNPVVNGAHGDITISWRGNPTFPVTMVLYPDSCPSFIGCSTPTRVFAERANPLVSVGALFCTVDPSRTPFVLDYSVYLEDANHVRTRSAKAAHTCLRG